MLLGCRNQTSGRLVARKLKRSLANLDICNPGGNPERKLPCKPSKNAYFRRIGLSWPPHANSFVCRRKLPSPFRHGKEQARFLGDLLSISNSNTVFVKPLCNSSAVLLSLRFSLEGNRLAVQGGAASPRRPGAAHNGPRSARLGERAHGLRAEPDRLGEDGSTTTVSSSEMKRASGGSRLTGDWT
jgi:hypothetical protein